MTLSVCFIVKNEEEVLPRALSCAKKFADEIVVVDTGSSDNSVEIARKYANVVDFFKWCDNFSAARNYCFSLASGDFVMWLDADDVISEENCKKIRALVNKGDFEMAYLLYAAAFDGDKPTYVYYRERILLRSQNYRFEGVVHEAISPRGKIIHSDACIEHRKVRASNPLRNVQIYISQISQGVVLDDRSTFYYGRELMFGGMYLEAAAVLEKFLSGDGWVENKIEACINLFHCYQALGDKNTALCCIFKSFLYDKPRAEACCILGNHFFENSQNLQAIYWYEAALKCEDNVESGGFVNRDFSGFIPYMQLCVLYDRLGEYEKASAFNDEAGKIKPQNKNFLSNRQYFKNKLRNKA